jgi:hypothetical protein
VSTAAAPSTGAISSAAFAPPIHIAPPSTIGSPAMNCGTTLLPTW